MASDRIKLNYELVQSASEIAEIARKLKKERIIAFDTEFIRESTFYPRLEIIQVATKDEAWLIDAQPAQTNPQSVASLDPLLEVFEDTNVIKVIHAALGDQECLYTAFGRVAKNTLDTSLAASLCGLGDGIGLANLLKIEMGIKLKKGHARTNWSQRPLPDQLLEYAIADVEYLVELGDRLIQKIEKLDRLEWAFELSSKMENTKLFEVKPIDITNRLYRSGKIVPKDYGVLFSLVEWREERVRALDLPRKWLAGDAVLMDITRVQPETLKHLKNFRGLNKGELKNNGEFILGQIKRGQGLDIRPPDLKKTRPPSSKEARAMDLLKCYVGLLADQNQIASRHLIAPDQFIALFRSELTSPEELIDHNLLSVGSTSLIGEKVIDFVHGKIGLTLNEKRVKIVETK